MQNLILPSTERGPLHLLCLGAHPDDIEIGCGGSVLQLLGTHPNEVDVTWCILSGSDVRIEEANRGAEGFLANAGRRDVRTKGFRDGFFPWEGSQIKEWFEALKKETNPDLIFTHRGDDRHQDHRVVSDLTWNTFRDHLILEYEVPKYDGDLGRPNLFTPLTEEQAQGKCELLGECFPSQRAKRWFERETFMGLMRLRAVEAGSPTPYAEGFHLRKGRISWTGTGEIR